MVAPGVEAVLLRAVRRRVERARSDGGERPRRLVGPSQVLDAVGQVAAGTSVIVEAAGQLEVRGAGAVLVPTLLGRPRPYVVVSHAPVTLAARLGPFRTSDDREVHQVTLQVRVGLTSSAALLVGLAEQARRAGAGLAEHVAATLRNELGDRVGDAIGRRSLVALTSTSLQVELDEALPRSFLGGALDRLAFDVTDVDWPTEGRGWRASPAATASRS